MPVEDHDPHLSSTALEAIPESLRSELCVAFLPIATLTSEENTRTSRISMGSPVKDWTLTLDTLSGQSSTVGEDDVVGAAEGALYSLWQ